MNGLHLQIMENLGLSHLFEPVVRTNSNPSSQARRQRHYNEMLMPLLQEIPLPSPLYLDGVSVQFESYTITNESTEYFAYQFDGKVLVRLKHPSTIYFSGVADITSIWNDVDVLGYRMTPGKNEATVYSLKGHGLLPIKTTLEYAEKQFNKNALQSRLNMYEVPEGIQSQCSEDEHLLIMRQSDEDKVLISILADDTSIPLYITETRDGPVNIPDVNLVGVNFQLETIKTGDWRLIPDEWNELARHLMWSREPPTGLTKTLIFGPSDLGKGLMLRFLVNKMLNNYPAVLVLDLDPQYSEFTMMGCLNVVEVTKPLLGPNFTHLRQPVKSIFIGGIKIEKIEVEYLQNVNFIMKSCLNDDRYQCIPWIISAVGFDHGATGDLMADLITIVSPTDVIEMRSSRFSQPMNMTERRVNMQRGNFIGDHRASRYTYFRYHVMDIHPMTEDSLKCPIRSCPWELKNNIMAIMYFVSFLGNIWGHATPSFRIPLRRHILERYGSLSELEFAVSMHDRILAIIIEEDNVRHCLGFGLASGVDIHYDFIKIITPADVVEELLEACHLEQTVMQIPEEIKFLK